MRIERISICKKISGGGGVLSCGGGGGVGVSVAGFGGVGRRRFKERDG